MQAHWRSVFEKKASSEVSWYQPHLELSLNMIANAGIRRGSRIIDVGGGDSTLVDDLLQRGFTEITVLDIASTAIARAKHRLGNARERITWRDGDILSVSLPNHFFGLWHDRAVFHFFVEEQDRRKYVSRAANAIKPNGHLIIGTFAADGPERCSGLSTMRYSAEALAQEFQHDFTLVESQGELHRTPQGKDQKFTYCRFRRNPL